MAAEDRNVVQIILQAQDNASAVVQGSIEGVGRLGQVALGATKEMNLLGTSVEKITQVSKALATVMQGSFSALATGADGVAKLTVTTAGLAAQVAQLSVSFPLLLTSAIISPVQSAIGAVDTLRSAFANPVGESFLQDIGREIEEALSEAQSLTSVTSSLRSGGASFVEALIVGDRNRSQGAIADAGRSSGENFGAAFSRAASGLISASVGGIADSIDRQILRSVDFVGGISGRVAGDLGGVSGIFKGIAGFDEPLDAFKGLQGISEGLTGTLFRATQELGKFAEGFEVLKGLVIGGPFELLIGQTVKLREQLLATQSTLAGTNKVVQEGLTLKDPTQAIQALTGPVNQAIAALRKGSLELVGVTSKDLIEAFQVVAGKAGEIGFSLQDATNLTLSFSAAMGTLQIPLFQARQEIGSVLSGFIDQNSILAKSLGLTNEMVARWKSQGTLVEQLNKRLEAFRAGNSLASQTLGGLTSNIQELVDEIGRLAGEQLLDPVLRQFQELYTYLNQNKDTIANSLGDLVAKLLKAAEAGVAAVKSVFGGLQGFFGSVPNYLVTSLANAITEFAGAVQTTVAILQPFLNVIAELAKNAIALGGPFLKIFLQFKVLEVGVRALGSSFGILTQTLPGVGELLFLLTGRSNSLINTFASLTGVIGQGGAGFLLLGKNMAAIPGLAGLIASKFGPLGPAIAGAIPAAAGLGIQLVGLAKAYEPVRLSLTAIAKQTPGAINGLAALAESSSLLGGAFAPFAKSLRDASKGLAEYTESTDLAALLNKKFADTTKLLGLQLRQQVISFGLLAGGVFAAVYIFDNFVLKNKNAVKGLQELGKKLQEIGKYIYQITGIEKIGNAIAVVVEKIANGLTALLSNPFALATTGAIAFGFALKSGVLSPLVQIADAIKNVKFGEINLPTEKVKEFGNQLGEVLSGTSGQEAKRKQADTLQKSITETAEQYKQAIADRRAKIAEIEKQIPDAQTNPFGNPEKLAADRQAIVQEIDQITEARKKQGRELANLKKETANIPQVSFGQRASGTVAQAKGGIASATGAGVAKLGEAIASIGFEGLGDRLGKTSEKMKDFGQKTLESAAAQNGFINNAKLTNAAVDGFGSTLTKARGAVVGFVGGIVSAAGPLVLLTAAIASVTEALTIYGEITNAQEQPLKDYNSALEEQRAKLEEILRLRGKLKEEPGPGEKPKSLEDKRKEELKGQQGFVTNTIDFFSKFGLFGAAAEKLSGKQITPFKDLRAEATFNAEVIGKTDQQAAIQKDVEQYKKGLEEIKKLNAEITQQRRRRSELESTRVNLANRGEDTKAIEKQIEGVDKSIAKAEEEIQVRKNLADESIKSVEKQKPPNEALQAGYRILLGQLKDIRGEMEKIGNTKILPQDLPRLGTTFEQLQGRAAQAENVLTKGGGNAEEVQKQAKDFIATTRQQLELNQITEEEARRRAKIVTDNVAVQAETQIEAQKLIADSFKSNQEERANAVEEATAEIERQVAEGVITEEEGAIKITEVKKRELDQQLADLNGQKGEEIAREKKATEEILKEIDRRIAETKLKLAQARGDKQGTAAAADELINSLVPKKEDLSRQITEVEGEINRLKDISKPGGRQLTAEESKKLADAQTKLDQLRTGLTDTESKITELNKAKEAEPGKADKNAANAAQAELEQLNKDKEKAIAASNNRTAEMNQQYNAKEARNRASAAQEARKAEEDEYKNSLARIQTEETKSQIEINNLKKSGRISSEQADQRTFDATKKRIADEIQLEEERIKKLSGKKGREKDVAEAQKRILDLQKQGERAEEDLVKGKIDRVQAAEVNAQFKINKLKESGAISSEQADERIIESTKKRIADELKIQEDLLKSLSGKKGKEKESAEVERRILDLKKQSVKVEEDFTRGKIERIAAAETAAQFEITKLKEAGVISSDEADKRILESTNKRIAAEIKAEEDKIARLSKKKGNEKEIADAEKRILDLKKQAADNEIKEIDRVQQRSLEVSKESELKRQIQLQKLENSGVISKEQADKLRALSTKRRIDEELKAEQAKLKALEGARNRDEKAIRASRLKVLELTKDSLQEEKQANEQVTKSIQDELKKRIDALADVDEQKRIQPLQEQLKLYELINQSLEIRNNILKASQDLGNAANDYLQQELQILSEGEVGEYRKKELAQATAAIKLQAAREQVALETQIFKIQQEQKRIALERKAIENEIAIAKKKAEIVKGAGQLQLAQQQLRTGQISKEEFAAIAAGQQGNFLELGALLKEGNLIKKEKAIQPLLEAAESSKFELDSRRKIKAAELDFANATPDVGERRRRVEALGDRDARAQGFSNRQEYVDDLIKRAQGAGDALFSGQQDKAEQSLQDLINRVMPQGVRKIQGSLAGAADDIKDFSKKEFQPGSLIEAGRAAAPSSGQLKFQTAESEQKKQQGAGGEVLKGFNGDINQFIAGLAKGATGFKGGPVSPGGQLSAKKGDEKGGVTGGAAIVGQGGVNFAPIINVEISTTDKKAASTMKNEVLKQLDDVTKKAERIAVSAFKKL